MLIFSLDAYDNLFLNNIKFFDSLLRKGWWYITSYIIDNSIMIRM